MIWAEQTLESLASGEPYAFVGGPFGSKLTSRDYVEDGVPVIRGSNMNGRRFLDMSEFAYVSDSKVREDLLGNLAKPGDLVFTQRGTLGQVALIPDQDFYDRYVVSQSQMKITLDERKADRRFLYYYFSSRQAVKKILSFVSSSGVPHINLTVLRNFKVPVPPLRTQKVIADILSAYDDLIENNNRRIQLLEQAARLLFKEWFVHLRFPGHEHVNIIDGVPEGWERKTLTSLAESVSYGLTARSTQDEVGPHFLRITDIVPEVLDWDGVPYCEATEKDIARNRLEVGNVVVARTGATVGYAKRISWLPSEAVYGSYLVRFRFSDPMTSLIAGLFMESGMFKRHVRNHAGGAAQPNANARVLDSALLLMPPALIRDLFGHSVAPLLALRDTLIRHSARLVAARDLLLPRLMSGEIGIGLPR